MTDDKKRVKVGIIGAGASGMMAAIWAAKYGAEVTLFEGNDKPGKKLLSTGNGKCNLTNMNMSADSYHSGEPEFIDRILDEFDEADLMNFFESNGLPLREREGYVYPYCEQAQAVADTLRFLCLNAGVHTKTGCRVTDLIPGQKGYTVITGEGSFSFERVILATGGKSAPGTGSDGVGYTLASHLGHTIVPVLPALVPLVCDGKEQKSISGIRAKACIKVPSLNLTEMGEIQFTDYGLSGIPVFQISAKIGYELKKGRTIPVFVDLYPDYTVEALVALLERKTALYARETAEKIFTGILPKKLMQYVLKSCAVEESLKARNLDSRLLWEIAERIKELRFTVIGTGNFEKAQVCAGGVSLKEVKTTLESSLCPGLYFCGELLDVDGKCGGYNLQWAFSTGYVAGKNCTR